MATAYCLGKAEQGPVRTRAVRLGSLLKTAFASHARISLLILGFQEGLDIQQGVTTGDVFANATTYMSNG